MNVIPTPSFSAGVRQFFNHPLQFRGRARRAEYWYGSIVCVLILMIFGGYEFRQIIKGDVPLTASILTFVWGVCYQIPASFRRLHDTGKSGWWILLTFVPFIGQIWLIILLLKDSQPATNAYGASPKYVG